MENCLYWSHWLAPQGPSVSTSKSTNKTWSARLKSRNVWLESSNWRTKRPPSVGESQAKTRLQSLSQVDLLPKSSRPSNDKLHSLSWLSSRHSSLTALAISQITLTSSNFSTMAGVWTSSNQPTCSWEPMSGQELSWSKKRLLSKLVSRCCRHSSSTHRIIRQVCLIA